MREISEKTQKKICLFFLILVKKYLDLLNKSNTPLILIIEDCNKIDTVINKKIIKFKTKK
jgi:hypothetical protein